MLVCIAGKNNIAVAGLNEALKLQGKYGGFELGIICNKTETGKNSWQKSLRYFAKSMNIKEYTLEEIYLKKDLIFISLEFDRIIDPQKFLSDNLFNIHFSLLPKYKGMYTSAIPILNGDISTGVTLHKIDNGIDTGDIIAQIEFDIDRKDTSRDLYIKYNFYAEKLLKKYLYKLIFETETLEAQKQSIENSSYYSKKTIDYSNLKINLEQTAVNIQNQIRAFSFREYQMPVIYDKKIIGSYITNIKSKSKPGTVIYENEQSMLLSTIDYNIVLYFDYFAKVIQACKDGDINTVKEICSVKEHINAQDIYGCTPLMIAALNGHEEIMYYLISNGANIFLKDNEGHDVIYYINEGKLNNKVKWLNNLI